MLQINNETYSEKEVCVDKDFLGNQCFRPSLVRFAAFAAEPPSAWRDRQTDGRSHREDPWLTSVLPQLLEAALKDLQEPAGLNAATEPFPASCTSARIRRSLRFLDY